MDAPLRVVFLVNADSNKSRAVVAGFAREWEFEETAVACVTDGTSGEAVEEVRARGYPHVVCDGTDDQRRAIREAAAELGGCDYLASVGWCHRVPEAALSVPETAALNVHSSYLPEYKGLSVHRAQWANAEETGGVTVHHMTESFDDGAIVAQQRYHIGLFDTPLEMTYTIGDLSAALLREAILKVETGYEGEPQRGEGEYYTKLPWSTVLRYGVVNHLYRLVGSEKRMPVPPDA